MINKTKITDDFFPHYFSLTHLQLDRFSFLENKNVGTIQDFLSLFHEFLTIIFRCKTYLQSKYTSTKKI